MVLISVSLPLLDHVHELFVCVAHFSHAVDLRLAVAVFFVSYHVRLSPVELGWNEGKQSVGKKKIRFSEQKIQMMSKPAAN